MEYRFKNSFRNSDNASLLKELNELMSKNPELGTTEPLFIMDNNGDILYESISYEDLAVMLSSNTEQSDYEHVVDAIDQEDPPMPDEYEDLEGNLFELDDE